MTPTQWRSCAGAARVRTDDCVVSLLAQDKTGALVTISQPGAGRQLALLILNDCVTSLQDVSGDYRIEPITSLGVTAVTVEGSIQSDIES